MSFPLIPISAGIYSNWDGNMLLGNIFFTLSAQPVPVTQKPSQQLNHLTSSSLSMSMAAIGLQ
jgi:hypothetical protein